MTATDQIAPTDWTSSPPTGAPLTRPLLSTLPWENWVDPDSNDPVPLVNPTTSPFDENDNHLWGDDPTSHRQWIEQNIDPRAVQHLAADQFLMLDVLFANQFADSPSVPFELIRHAMRRLDAYNVLIAVVQLRSMICWLEREVNANRGNFYSTAEVNAARKTAAEQLGREQAPADSYDPEMIAKFRDLIERVNNCIRRFNQLRDIASGRATQGMITTNSLDSRTA